MMAVVLSNQEQLELFRNAKLTASSVKIYCDDEHFFAELQRKRIKYHPLNEFRLQPQWNDINAWGCQTACRWITASKEGGFFKTIDFASVFYLFFSHLLVQGLKNLHYARRIVENPDVRRVAVFDTVAPNVFPEFSGNGFLNYFLKQLAETKGKETIILRSVASARSELVRVPKSGWVKALVEKSYAFFVRPGCKPSLWVYGSLMHLESLLPELKRQKVPFFYYNQELNIDQLKFSIWHRIPYYIRSSFPEAQVLPSVDFVKEKGKPTNHSIIFNLSQKDRTIIAYRGASELLAREDIPWDKMGSRWFYLAPLSGLACETSKSIINFAKEKEIKIAFNPGTFQISLPGKILSEILSKIDILILNQEEASFLTKIPFIKEKEIFEKIDKMCPGIAIMTKGAKGVVASDGRYFYSANVLKTKVVDKTGAGDSFGAGFVSGFIKANGDIGYAMQLGIANSASCLQQWGAKNGLLGEGDNWEKVKIKKLKYEKS